MKRLVKFLILPAANRRILLEAVVFLGIARLTILSLPFRRIAPWLGAHQAVTPELPLPACTDRIRRIRWAVETASRHVPWEALCLSQAMAAKWMLHRYGVASTLYLGLRKGTSLQAHAWIRAGDMIVTGYPGRWQYTVISSFA